MRNLVTWYKFAFDVNLKLNLSIDKNLKLIIDRGRLRGALS